MHEANRILRSVKAALAADGIRPPNSAETDGLMMLLGRIDGEKFLVQKIRHARSAAPNSTARKRGAAYLAFFRALLAHINGIPDPATTVSFTMLNRALFGDLEDAAGRMRQGEYIENGSAHTDAKYIAGSIKSIIAKMNELPSSPTIGKEDFAGYLTHYMRELIILHPFECGSPFTVRMFMMLFCQNKGFSLCYYRVPPAAIKAAEDAAFVADDVTALFRIFSDCLSYEQKTERKRTVPRTRRELNRDRVQTPDPDYTYEPIEQEEKAEKRERADRAEQRPEHRRPQRPTEQSDDKLKRAIKLQQKISRLNEQLAELMVEDADNK